MSIFHSPHFNHFRAFRFATPRRPRHPLLRIAFGLLSVMVLLLLVVAGVFIGAAMLLGGALLRLWQQRGKPRAQRASRDLDGEYRVIKPDTPHIAN